MDISILDGFFTALAIAPNTLLPSQWLPEVWGETEEDPMAFADEGEARRVSELIMRFYNDRMLSLDEDIDEFDPLLYEEEIDGRRMPILEHWCVGFIAAIRLDLEGWKPLMEAPPEKEGALLAPMLLHGTEEGWSQLDAQEAIRDSRESFADAIPSCVLAIREYWLPHRKAASTFRRETAKVGRNDLCPCGSGKKFKKCCGRESVH